MLQVEAKINRIKMVKLHQCSTGNLHINRSHRFNYRGQGICPSRGSHRRISRGCAKGKYSKIVTLSVENLFTDQIGTNAYFTLEETVSRSQE